MPEVKVENLLYARGLTQNGIAVPSGLVPPESRVIFHSTHPPPDLSSPLFPTPNPAGLGITWHWNVLLAYSERPSCQKRNTPGPFFFATQNLAVEACPDPPD